MDEYQTHPKSLGLHRSHHSLPTACNHYHIKNKICKLEGLDHLMNLEYLAINDNHIAKVENLQMLKKLQGLNISNN